MFQACNRDNSVSKIYSFSNSTWQRFNFLNFDFPIEEEGEKYDIYVLLRYTDDFPSQALLINLVMTLPGGEVRIRDYKLEVRGDDKNLLGSKKAGYYERLIPVRKAFHLSETGLLKFEIENLMTKYYTPGMVEFGIVLEESAEK
jgi:gliding motility-associated lipoprotein GldH